MCEKRTATDMPSIISQLEQQAKPIVKLLREQCHPHCAVIITQDAVRLMEDVLSLPQPVQADS